MVSPVHKSCCLANPSPVPVSDSSGSESRKPRRGAWGNVPRGESGSMRLSGHAEPDPTTAADLEPRGLEVCVPVGRAAEAPRKVVDKGADFHRHQPIGGIDSINRAGWKLPSFKHAP